MKGKISCQPETHKRIEAHIRKHRASGGGLEAKHGETESPEDGDDTAEKDLKDKPMHYTADSKVNEEAEREKAKRGGKMKEKKKKIVMVVGEKAMHHAGRKARASGGSAEDHPFTTAHKGTEPTGRKTMRNMPGLDA